MANYDDRLQCLHAELSFDFVRSSGPGGQNVNKVATAAQLRFDIRRSLCLSDETKARLVQLGGRRVTTDGILIIEARRHRTQEQNRVDALLRFDNLVRRAIQRREPRIPTKATRASRERRLESKKRKGEIKKERQARSFEA